MRVILVAVLLVSSGCSFVKEGSSISATTQGSETSETDGADPTTATESTTIGATTEESGSTTGDETETAATGTVDPTSDTTTETTAVTDATTDTTSDPAETSETTDCACGAPGEVWEGVTCTDECTWDWSGAPQWWCYTSCSPVNGGQAWGLDGCDQADADLFCKFLTGDPDAVAPEWDIADAQPTSGFCCPSYGGESVGPFPEFEIDSICYLDGNLIETHGPGYVILASEVTCAVP